MKVVWIMETNGEKKGTIIKYDKPLSKLYPFSKGKDDPHHVSMRLQQYLFTCRLPLFHSMKSDPNWNYYTVPIN